jgi:lipopolysaccharide/colanic/teichoic acid biosynthesis glycosyltransferase
MRLSTLFKCPFPIRSHFGSEDIVAKLNHDLFYVNSTSLIMELMILTRTVEMVLAGKGAR